MSGASLAAFRVVYGCVGVVSMARLLAYGWAETLYAGPRHHLSYPGLGWIRPPGTTGTTALITVVGIAAAFIAVGALTRVATAVFVAGFGWIEFVDVSTYLNHYWFVTLAGLLLLATPADTRFAVHRRERPTVRRWVWTMRVTVGSVYVFAALAKLNADWLLHGLPLRLWLPARSDMAVVGPLLDEPIVARAMSWAGFAFDASIVVVLSRPRWRSVGWAAVIVFHVVTGLLFPIGVFPWLMIGATTVFFEPDWPDRIVRRSPLTAPLPAAQGSPQWSRNRRGAVLAAAWTAASIAMPLRGALVPGDSRWTGEGYRFAWNVLAVEKAGDVRFRVCDLATGRTTIDDGGDLYSQLQWKVMATEPELIRQTAHAIAAERRRLGADVAVMVDSFVSLNGRPAVRMIDPSVDLSREPYRPFGQPWILPEPTHPAP